VIGRFKYLPKIIKEDEILNDQLPMLNGVSIGSSQAQMESMKENPIPIQVTKRSFLINQRIIANAAGAKIQRRGALIWIPQYFLD
jgi:hypothetical protein